MRTTFLFILLTSCFVLNASSRTKNQLHQNWQMCRSTSNEWLPAVVPGCVHTDLIRNLKIEDPYYRLNEKYVQWIDKQDWEYKTTFDADSLMKHFENIQLVFEGLDTYSDIYINGKKIGTTDNMFRKWEYPVSGLLKKGKNELLVRFYSPINRGLELLNKYPLHLPAPNDQSENGGLLVDQKVSPFIRKAPYHFGWDWGPRFVTSGIWLPVYLDCWNSARLNDVYVQQLSLTDKNASLRAAVEVEVETAGFYTVSVDVNDKTKAEKKILLKKGINNVELPFQISNPKRWWTNGLGNAYLYTVKTSVGQTEIIDTFSRKIGLRTLKLIQNKDDKGYSFYFELNGKPLFAKGANHIPNDAFLDRVTPELYKWEIGTARQSNFNMLRVWGGGIYEKELFYNLCDENGILVWQDFMFACSLYPGDTNFLQSVKAEAEYQVKRLRNHPCIALWCGNNEIDQAWQQYNPNGGWGWKQQYTELQRDTIWKDYTKLFKKLLPEVVNNLQPNAPYWQSSPISNFSNKHSLDTCSAGDVHYWGVWWGKKPFEKYADNIGRFMSEYGFQSFPELESVKKYALPDDYDIESDVMEHHQRSSIGNVTIRRYMDMYYQKPLSFEKFLYTGQVLQAYGIQFAIESHRRAMPFNMGSLVWQINDCWPVASWSSCDYFHRWKALQYQMKRSFEPFLISSFTKSDSTVISLVADRPVKSNLKLKLTVFDFDGKVQKTVLLPVKIAEIGSQKIAAFLTNKLTNNPKKSVLVMELVQGATCLSTNLFYFTQPKNLELNKPTFTYNIAKKKNFYEINFTSNELAKNVYFNFPDTEGFFSDNYFDILPGKMYAIRFKPANFDFQLPALELMSLFDSYSN